MPDILEDARELACDIIDDAMEDLKIAKAHVKTVPDIKAIYGWLKSIRVDSTEYYEAYQKQLTPKVKGKKHGQEK